MMSLKDRWWKWKEKNAAPWWFEKQEDTSIKKLKIEKMKITIYHMNIMNNNSNMHEYVQYSRYHVKLETLIQLPNQTGTFLFKY